MPLCDRVTRRLVPGHRQRDHEQSELLIGELVAVDIGRDQVGDNVIAGMVGFVCGELHAVKHQFAGRHQSRRSGELGVLVPHHVVRPVKKLGTILERNPQQSGDRLQWQFASHLRHEISGSRCGCRLRHDAASSLRQILPEAIHRSRSEPPRHDLAHSGVLRSIHVDHREPAGLDLSACRLLVDIAWDDAVLGAGEHVAAPRHLSDVAVPAHHPVAAVGEPSDARGLLVPPDRRCPSQLT